MVHTQNATIDITYVLSKGSGDTSATTSTVHAEVLFGGNTSIYSTGVAILQPTDEVDGYIKINVPIEIGNSTLRLMNASNAGLETDGTTVERLGMAPVMRTGNATEVLV